MGARFGVGLLMVAAAAAFSGRAGAALVYNVDFQSGSSPLMSGMAAYTGDAGSWNGLIRNQGTAAQAIADSTGNFAAGVTLSSGSPAGSYSNTLNSGGVNPTALMNDLLFTSNASGTIELNNLPVNSYFELYLYGEDNQNHAGTNFTVNGVVQSTDLGNTTDTTLILGNDYVIYSAVPTGPTGSITIGFTSNGRTQFGIFNGLQAIGPIPEPATLGVLGIGAMGLMARRRRLRR